MRTFILSLILFLILVGVSTWSQIYLSHESKHLMAKIDELESCIESDNWKEALKKIADMEDELEKREYAFSAILNHNETMQIYQIIAEATQFINHEHKPLAMAKVHELKHRFRFIYLNNELTIKNVF